MKRGRERSWFTFDAQLSTEDVGATSRDANSLIGLTCGVLISSTTPLNGVTKDAAFSYRQWRCHDKGKDALGDGEYDVRALARECIRSQRRAVLGRDRVKEGGRLKEAFLLMKSRFVLQHLT